MRVDTRELDKAKALLQRLRTGPGKRSPGPTPLPLPSPHSMQSTRQALEQKRVLRELRGLPG